METKSLDSIFDDLDLSRQVTQDKVIKANLSIWIPVDYKQKYDRIQNRTNREFSARLCELVKQVIDKVYLTKDL